MKKTTGEKKIGFYLVMAAAVLSLVSMLIYRTVLSQLGMVYGLSVIPAIVAVLVLAGMKMTGAKELLNWAGPVNAVVTALNSNAFSFSVILFIIFLFFNSTLYLILYHNISRYKRPGKDKTVLSLPGLFRH